MNSFRLTTVENTMLIYVNSFRFCQPYFPVESHKLYLSRIVLSLYKIERIIKKNPNITIMFPFYNLFKYAKFVQ